MFLIIFYNFNIYLRNNSYLLYRNIMLRYMNCFFFNFIKSIKKLFLKIYWNNIILKFLILCLNFYKMQILVYIIIFDCLFELLVLPNWVWFIFFIISLKFIWLWAIMEPIFVYLCRNFIKIYLTMQSNYFIFILFNWSIICITSWNWFYC